MNLAQDWNPHAYQLKAVKFLLGNAGAGLFLDPGLGKTSIVLAALKILKQKSIARRTLVIAPLRVCYNVWPAEQEKWTDFKDLKIAVLHGPGRERSFNSDADIYVINPEGLPWLCEDRYSRFKDLELDTLIVDESSKFKATNTQRFKLMRPVLDSFSRRYILTGSPMPNGYLDLFGQMFIVDQGRALGQFITHYRMMYFYQSGYGGYTWAIKPGADKQIQERIRPSTMRLDAEDYVAMPEIVGLLGTPSENIHWVDLPKKVRALYDELEEDMIAVLEDGKTITAVSAAALSTKCAQVANGGIYHMVDDWKESQEQAGMYRKRTWTNLHTEKVDEVRDICDELQGGAALVAYDFEHDLCRLTKEFPKALLLGGTPAQSRAAIEMWNSGSYSGPMFGHPASMGHGLNLQGGGNHIIIHSIPWDFDHYDQFIRRIRRQGSRHGTIYVHHIAAHKTVDVAKMQALRRKSKTQGSFLQALKDYARQR